MWSFRFKPEKKQSRVTVAAPPAGGDFDNIGTALITSLQRYGITPRRLADILQGAVDGTPREQAILFTEILDKEPIIATHFDTRFRAVTARAWEINCDDQGKADEITDILSGAKINSLINTLLNAIPFGYSASAIKWLAGGGGIESFQEIAQQNIIFDLAGNPAFVDDAGKEHPLSEWHPNQFIFYVRPGTGHPARRGLLRRLVWLFLYKHYAIRDRARFIEKYGMPVLLAKISQTDFEDEPRRNAILDSLRRSGADGAGVTTGESEITVVQATTAASTDAYQQWFDYIDGCFAKAILGQEASSGKAEGLSKGGAQAEVRDDICQADRKDIAEIINDAIVGPLERFKYNSSDAKFQFEDDPEDLTQKATIIQTLAAAGFKPTREWVSETFNMPLAEEEERISNNEQGTRNNEVKGGEAAIKPAGGRLTANGRQTAFSQSEGLRNAISDYPGALRESATPPLANSQIRKFTNSAAPADAAKERFISAATESALRGLFDDEEAMAAFYAPLRAEVRGAFKGIALDDPALVEKFTERARGFLESLPAVYAEMDKSALEQTLQKAVFSALARGYTGQMS